MGLTDGSCNKLLENKPLTNLKASDNVAALKNIHAKTVNKKVNTILINSFNFGTFLSWATINKLDRLDWVNKRGKKYNAFKKPQKTKVQFAPCQKPLTRKIINVFLICMYFPPLLPPKGIYK